MEEELVDLSVRHSSGDLHMKSLGKHATFSGTVLPYIAAACLGAILFGYHLGVVNGALNYIAKDLGFAKNTALQGWVVGIALASATIGSFTGGAFSDKLGRRRTLQLAAIPLAVGALVSALAQNIQAMITGRLLAGVGIGITSSIVPLYISEVSPTDIRGALGSVNQIFICIGILVALVAGLPLAGNPSWWRTIFGISVIPAVLMILGMAFSPETPRWLIKQGKLAEAEAAIKELWGRQKADEAMFELRSRTRDVMEKDVGWYDLFSRRYRKGITLHILIIYHIRRSSILRRKRRQR